MTDTVPHRDRLLVDGTTVQVRPIRPDDAPLVLAMWRRLSVDTIYSRFFGLVRLDETTVGPQVVLDPAQARAVVSTLGRGDDEQIIGMARYDRLDDPDTAEFSALVEDAHQGRGIGTALLRELAEEARRDGVRTLTGEILRANGRMLRLVTDLGLATREAFEYDLVHASFEVQPTDEYLAAIARDEKRAAKAALIRFLRPSSVAVVGASDDPLDPGAHVLASLLAARFEGPVYPVNPGAVAVHSVLAYPSLGACPQVPELVFVSTPAEQVVEAVDEAGTLGVHAVCVLSGGFAEAGPAGEARQIQLLEAARSHGLRLLGPNCMGVLNAAGDVRLNGTYRPTLPGPGNVAILSQSGALSLSMLDRLHQRGAGLSSFLSVGNKADISANDALLHWEDDPASEVIALYIESFGNARRFARIARRIARSKPIVAVKGGRGPSGQRAAAAHTAAPLEEQAAVEALFGQAGVVSVGTLGELVDVVTLAASGPPPAGRGVGIVTNGGGPGTLAADACEVNGLRVPSIHARTRRALAGLAAVSDRNPVDLGFAPGASAYRAATETLAADPAIDAVIAVSVPRVGTDPAAVLAELAAARGSCGIPVLGVALGTGEQAVRPVTGVPLYAFPERAARALARVVRWREWRDRPRGAIVRPAQVDPAAARAVLARLGGAAPPDQAGLRGLRHTRAPAESVAVPGEAVSAVLAAYGIARGSRGEDAIALRIAANHDATFGTVVRLGFAEGLPQLTDDAAVRITPLDDLDIVEMIESLRGYPLLAGHHHQPARDIAALQELLVRVNALVEDLPEVASLELAPVHLARRGRGVRVEAAALAVTLAG